MKCDLPEFVRVLVCNDVGALLVLAENRSTIVWNFPGGRVDNGETPEAAAIREVREEVGLVVSDLKHLQTVDVEINERTWRGYFFFANSVRGVPSIRERHRCSELRYVTQVELNELPAFEAVLQAPAQAFFAKLGPGLPACKFGIVHAAT